MFMKTIKLLSLLFFFPSLAIAQDQFLGQIMFVPYNFTPSTWHDCDGSLIKISGNEALYSLIGTTYGGDGQTTFALPNAQGRVIIDDGTSKNLSTYQLGQTGGTESVTLTTNQMPSHTHPVRATTSVGTQNSPTNGIPANTKALDKEYSNTTDTASKTTMKPTMLNMAGGNSPHNNMMPTLALRCIISMSGIYPSHP